MSVNTKALIPAHLAAEDIADLIRANYLGKASDANAVSAAHTHTKDYVRLMFAETSHSPRSMSVFLNSYAACDNADLYQGPQTGLMLGASGDSVVIMRAILESTGGWLLENDCNDDDYVWVDAIRPYERVSLKERIQVDVARRVSAALAGIETAEVPNSVDGSVERLRSRLEAALLSHMYDVELARFRSLNGIAHGEENANDKLRFLDQLDDKGVAKPAEVETSSPRP